MQQVFVVPQTNATFTVHNIIIDIENKLAIVNTEVNRGDTQEVKVAQIDITAMIAAEGYTATQITTIKKFFKNVVAEAWEITIAEVLSEVL